MLYKSIVISRKARVWPEIARETVLLPSPPTASNPADITTFALVVCCLAGLIVYGIISFYLGAGPSNLYGLVFVIASGFIACAAGAAFVFQVIKTHHRNRQLLMSYRQELQAAEKRLQLLAWKERQAHIDMNPPLVLPTTAVTCYENLSVTPLIKRDFDDQDTGLWARRAGDPDFLALRIGMGRRAASFKVQKSADDSRLSLPGGLERYNRYARSLLQSYTTLAVPLTVRLDKFGPLAIVGTHKKLLQARELACAMVSQLAYHHSPADVRVIVLAPGSQAMTWRWATHLPHTAPYDPRQGNEYDMALAHTVAIGTDDVINQLPAIAHELNRRQHILNAGQQATTRPEWPHLVIVVDHFDPDCDLDQTTISMPAVQALQENPVLTRPRLSVTPLKHAELALALSQGAQLGVSALCICASKADVPTSSGMLIDLDVTPLPDILTIAFHTAKLLRISKPRKAIPAANIQPEMPQAYIRLLHPNAPSMIACDLLDSAPIDALRYFGQRMQPLRPMSPQHLGLRAQVDLGLLFDPPLNMASYDPLSRWCMDLPLFRTWTTAGNSLPSLRIPIGLQNEDEVQYLDFSKDGPHGILIGQAGSGKNELLQTIITALAVIYHPAEVNFLILDFKEEPLLEPFRRLPHTIGFYTHASSASALQRFITMLRAEVARRQEGAKAGRNAPRLMIFIKEFTEMAKCIDGFLDELFSIVEAAPQGSIHLLLSAQRPEGLVTATLREHVQYRLCLRCASPGDSREVLRRIDAAHLPPNIAGRGYLLHGNNQLDLFQAAYAGSDISYERVSAHSRKDAAMPSERALPETRSGEVLV